jgi:hypothetical protein
VQVAHDLCKGTKHTIVECLTQFFRFFLDLDYETKTGDPLTDEQLLGHARVFQTCIRRCYPHLPRGQLAVIVCDAPAKPLEAGWKHGVHAYFRVYVDGETALVLRHLIVEELGRASTSEYTNSFESIVDGAPFASARGSLRMQGSDKYNKSTKTLEGRVYAPRMVVGADGNLNPAALDLIRAVPGPTGADLQGERENFGRMVRLIRNTSVRWGGGATPGFVPPPGRRAVALGPGRAYGRQATSEGTVSSEAVLAAKEAVRTCFGDAYENLEIGEVIRLGKAIIAKPRADSEQAKACHNLQSCGDDPLKSHTSSTIYFVITRKRVSQRCRCTKSVTDNRIEGTCRAFTEKGGHVAPKAPGADLVKHMFGGKRRLPSHWQPGGGTKKRSLKAGQSKGSS